MSFPPNSRYRGVPVATLERPGAPPIAYLRRRFVPQPEASALLVEHLVTEDERLDTITARYLADPELFWRLCDANRALHPDELTAEPGRWLSVPLPQ